MVWPGKGMTWKELFVSLKEEWNDGNLGDVAGALTFNAVLAVFPFLLFLVSLASVLITPDVADSLISQLHQVAPAAVTQILSDRIRSLSGSNNVGLLTVSGVGAIWAASGGIMALMRALNTAYDVRESRPFWKTRGIALLMTIFAAAFALVAGFAAVALPPIVERFGGPLASTLVWLRIPIAALLIMFLWAVLYYVLPDVEQDFKFITPGSVVGVVIWAAASWAFSLYVTNFGKYEVIYGALGGIVIFLLWLWISAQVMLLGAEINAVIEHKSPEGKRVGAKSMADTGPDTNKAEKEREKREELEARAYGRPPYHRPIGPVTATKIAAKNALGVAALGFLFRRFRKA